ncbi:MAG: site-specific DNA-methyltransferase [Clostridia bacterium]|nr:site-specific DNA-methyltransferase [Clostridia bacterium]
MNNLLTIAEASAFASQLIGKLVTESNISYLIQYGRIDKFVNDGVICVQQGQLVSYYESFRGKKEIEWKNKLGNDINWELSFDGYKESETTKHVHRLHPYKGKYIPQLVEYFLDEHTDSFKKEIYFHPGDIVIDPFCGSGTTLVQANELGMHAVGFEISAYNAQISNAKIRRYDIAMLKKYVDGITIRLQKFEAELNVSAFEQELLAELYKFNTKYFPSPDFKKKVYTKQIIEKEYGREKEKEFLPNFIRLAKKHQISLDVTSESFLERWYFETARKEIYYVNSLIEKVENSELKELLQVILSRTMRSCRATTHSDLATLIEPVYTTYYCTKHKKICKPLFSILKWWKTYSKDTVKRIEQFAKINTNTMQKCFAENSATVDIERCILGMGGVIASTYREKKIKGIFCSPPYVGLIDYHEQHAYAYELYGLDRRDDLEIGSMQKGSTKLAQQAYVEGVSSVLLNCKKYLTEDYEVFIVANDKFGLYQEIAEKAGMTVVEQFKRPVLNRTEKDKNAYSETIFRMKEKK